MIGICTVKVIRIHVNIPSRYSIPHCPTPPQRLVYRQSQVPDELVSVVDKNTFDKSRAYQLDKSTYSICYSLYKQIEFLVGT